MALIDRTVPVVELMLASLAHRWHDWRANDSRRRNVVPKHGKTAAHAKSNDSVEWVPAIGRVPVTYHRKRRAGRLPTRDQMKQRQAGAHANNPFWHTPSYPPTRIFKSESEN